MSTFDNREKAFEAKFAHDAEMQFKAEARRNRLVGLWAADIMGMGEADAEAYARTVIAADFEEAGHEDVVRKVVKDLTEHGSQITADEVRAQLREMLVQAKQSLAEDAS